VLAFTVVAISISISIVQAPPAAIAQMPPAAQPHASTATRGTFLRSTSRAA
jgi:hypothetical protein